MTYIQARGIQKSYGQRNIVKGVDMDINKNEILAVIGPNGAGKTTILEILIGLRKADEGEINYWLEKYKAHIGVQLQAVPFFPGLSARENLKLFAAFYKKVLSKNEVEMLLNKCGLLESGQTEASKLSGGTAKAISNCCSTCS